MSRFEPRPHPLSMTRSWALSCVLLAGCALDGSCGEGWALHALPPPNSDYYHYPSVAIGPDDRVHFVYSSAFHGLYHAEGAGGRFNHTLVVREAENSPAPSDLEVDARGRLHVVYSITFFEAGSGAGDHVGFGYAVRDGAWELDETQLGAHYPSSIALDGAGRPNIAVGDAGGEATRVFRREADGTWSAEPVAGDGALAMRSEIAVDDDDVLHVVYGDEATSGLRYARRSAEGVWDAPIEIDAEPWVSLGSFAVGPGGHAAVTYYDRRAERAMIALREGGEWHREEVAAVAGEQALGLVDSIAVDADGDVHLVRVAWSPSWGDRLVYGEHTFGAPWEWTVLDEADAINVTRSIALDSRGRPHVVYTRGNPGGSDELVYAAGPCSVE